VRQLITYMKTIAGFRKNNMPKSAELEYSCIEEYVLKNGQPFEDGIMQARPLGKARQCFSNAQKFILRNPGCDYVEGYAFGVIPTLHAWAVIRETGEVVETTWKELGTAYFGVVIPRAYLYKMNLERGKYGILDGFDVGYPLLTGRDKLEDYKKGGQNEKE